ncbi:MAG: endonuclease Q family protein [Methanosarcinaceae archaeon]|nr:endonuclease Q family protein [Methanosarcinaceae archaeon]
MEINVDLHIHSKYAAACSDKMDIETISSEAKKKRIDVMGTGDCLHPLWLKEIKRYSKNDEKIISDDTVFIPTVEIEDKNKVHHLLIIPSLSKVEEISEKCKKFGNLKIDGRAHLNLSGEEIGQIAYDSGAIFGPCHAFTPWTGMYGFHDSVFECYGDLTKRVSFLELGLSADTNGASKIDELNAFTFISSSDAHSPWSNKLGREFTRFSINEIDKEDISFDEIKSAILYEKNSKPVLNVGFFPEEGKYYSTACINPNCNIRFMIKEAEIYKWKCPECRSKITKGVSDRIEELSKKFDSKNSKETKTIERPPYLHIIPLAEIIMNVLGHKSVSTKGVLEIYNELVNEFGTEINVLLNLNKTNSEKIPKNIVNAIEAFQKNEIEIIPGGGGQYGSLKINEIRKENDQTLVKNKQDLNNKNHSNRKALFQNNEINYEQNENQKSLFDF